MLNETAQAIAMAAPNEVRLGALFPQQGKKASAGVPTSTRWGLSSNPPKKKIVRGSGAVGVGVAVAASVERREGGWE